MKGVLIKVKFIKRVGNMSLSGHASNSDSMANKRKNPSVEFALMNYW